MWGHLMSWYIHVGPLMWIFMSWVMLFQRLDVTPDCNCLTSLGECMVFLLYWVLHLMGFFFLFVKCYWYWFSSVGGREEKPTCITSHNISTACDLGHIQTHPCCNSVHDCPLWILTAFLLAFVWVHYQVCEWEVSQLVEINEGILQYHAFGCCGRSKFLLFILLYQQSGIQLNSIQYIFLLFNRKKMWNLIQ